MTGIAAGVANGLLTAMMKGSAYSIPHATHVQMHIGDPGAAGTANPAANTTRKASTFGTDAAAGSIANTVAVVWDPVPATEVYTHFTLWTAETSGTFCASGTVTGGSVTSGQIAQFAIGALTVTHAIAA